MPFAEDTLTIAKKHGLTLLLWLGIVLKGAKTPLTFCIWGSCVLLFCGLALWETAETLTIAIYKRELAAFFCLCTSLFFSQDWSVSCFSTLQMLVFLLLWVSLKSNPSLIKNQKTLFPSFVLSGLLATGLTIWQMCTHDWAKVYGFLPINPVFNATWLASIGIALLSSSVNLRQKRLSDLSTKSFFVRIFSYCQSPFGTLLLGIAILAGAGLSPARSVAPALVLSLLYVLRPFMNARRIIFSLLALTIVLTIIPQQLVSRKLRLNEGNYRTQIWRIATSAISRHPITGWGLSNFEMAYQQYAFPVYTDPVRFNRTTQFAHNEYLQTAADLGLFAFILLLVAVASTLFASTHLTPVVQRPAKASFIVLCVVATTNITWHLPILVYATLISAALLLAPQWPLNTTTPARFSFRIYAISLLACVALGLLATAVRDQWASNQQWERILHINPYDASAWEEWAAQRTEPGPALQGYARAAALVPGQFAFHESLARAFEASRRLELLPPAIREYEQAMACSPSRAVDALAIGRSLFKLGQYASALDEFRRARLIEPNYWECDLWEARCHFQLGQTCQALKALQFLRRRRLAFTKLRSEVSGDLPSGMGQTNYGQEILAFDEKVVEEEETNMKRNISQKERSLCGLPAASPLLGGNR